MNTSRKASYIISKTRKEEMLGYLLTRGYVSTGNELELAWLRELEQSNKVIQGSKLLGCKNIINAGYIYLANSLVGQKYATDIFRYEPNWSTNP